MQSIVTSNGTPETLLPPDQNTTFDKITRRDTLISGPFPTCFLNSKVMVLIKGQNPLCLADSGPQEGVAYEKVDCAHAALHVTREEAHEANARFRRHGSTRLDVGRFPLLRPAR